ncbi:uncharacterized protein LOC129757425 [Uranotaenia lowii]|uniref:uncharacterized protein LOC129757425 n=1 Tax=Uranotaenia lowii TaxID=190385 RepID=UPI00247985B6|nr:uncharacterized protein LOC129757425 [Uranotaenia lowii]
MANALDSISLTSQQFVMHLPRPPVSGDEISLKVKLKDDFERFSVNLCQERTEGNHHQAEADRIVYHFGLLSERLTGTDSCAVLQNHKNSRWSDLGSVSSDEGFCSFPFLYLIFRFQIEGIKVFVDDTQHSPDYEHDTEFPIETIRTVELWDDLDRIEEITLRYAERS